MGKPTTFDPLTPTQKLAWGKKPAAGTIRANDPLVSSVREWYINEALHSFRRLQSILDELTEAEAVAALSLERGSRRRKTVMRLLTDRAVELHLRVFHNNLD